MEPISIIAPPLSHFQAITWAAAAYQPIPDSRVQRIGWQDVTADLFEIDADTLGIAVQGTNPEKLANLARDMDVRVEPCRMHPAFGLMFAGALDAAEGLLPLILGLCGARRVFPLGHSLGGQIAVDLAVLLLERLAGFWGFDPPKSGEEPLVAALAPFFGAIDRFAGSIVSRWPFDQGVHVRPPVMIGDWTPLWLQAHEIVRAAQWVATHELVGFVPRSDAPALFAGVPSPLG